MTQASTAQPMAFNNLAFEDTIAIPAPINEVYRRWSDFERFPQFMANVEEVTPIGGNRYHWVARIFGAKQEWDAEVTENTPQRTIAWRSITGSHNAGTVSFFNEDMNQTLVRVHFEYALPNGNIGQALDQAVQGTRHEVHEDLENFKKLYAGGMQEQDANGLTQEDAGGIGRVLSPLAVPIAASVAGGVASYIIGRRLRERRFYDAISRPIAPPHAVAGWVLVGASAASVLGSAALRSRGRAADAVFVGHWAPTLLGMGALARLMGHRGMHTSLESSVASWACLSASLGSVVGSAFLHLRGSRNDGVFVGHWAPTLLNAAIFARLVDRLATR